MCVVENTTGVLTWISVTCEEMLNKQQSNFMQLHREGKQHRVTHVDLKDK